jgi:excisionase family DNA binding protein
MNPISVSPEQAAELTGIGRTRIFDLMKSGDLPSFKCGRTRHIRYKDLSDFVDSLMEKDKARIAAADKRTAIEFGRL